MSATLQIVRGLDQAAERRALFDKLGDLSEFRVTMNRILLAVWVRPNTRQLANGAVFHLPDSHVDEDKWQGVSALVVKMGPQAFESDASVQFTPDDRCDVGDWVLFRKGEGFRVQVNGHECIMLDSERGIKAVIPRPDVVY
jgi:co-chaperonin GroES (HSP10)